MSAEGGVWAYAVLHGDAAEDRVADLCGVADETVRVVASVDLAAAVGSVGLDEFGQDALRRNLEDLDWWAAKARAHDAVIAAIARSGPVIPVRMATVYRNDGRVRQLLQSRRDEFEVCLDRLTGRAEWGVKAFADPNLLAAHDTSAGSNPVGHRSGTAYLLRRRRELASHEAAYRVAASHAELIHTALLQQAVEGKRKPAPHPILSGTDAWTVLNGTYLVEEARADRFTAKIAELDQATDGITLEITGPWPPYSFTGDVVSP